MTLLLLDTDTVINLLNRVHATQGFVDRLLTTGDTLSSCDIVVTEVLSGTRPADRHSVGVFLDTLDFLPSTPDVGRIAGQWRFDLAQRGITLATPDAIIAATAFVWNATLVTGNTRHYPMSQLSILPLPP
ncbi:MAG: PIN domain-containing protein [Thermomicrobiales bacterium]